MNAVIRHLLNGLHVASVRIEDTRGPHPLAHDHTYSVAHAIARWTDRVLHRAHR